MAELVFTKLAIRDLTEIWEYTIDIWSEKQADKYYKLLIDSIHELQNKSDVGKEYNQIKKGLKGIKIAKHIIFYRVLGKSKIEITRILHEEMDLKNHV